MQDFDRSLALSCTFKMVQGILQEEPGELLGRDGLKLLAAGTVIDSKYRIVNVLGEGGMGVVYRANHLSLGNDVALKTFRSADLSFASWERFQREAQAIAKLVNKNIVRVFDFGIGEDNQPYYTMELLSGESLAERIRRHGPLPLAEALAVFTAVAEGLVSAHAKEIVHRDLKPENIFLVLKGDEIESVKLVDFGIAKLAGAIGPDAQRLTAAGTIFGSPLYMSPEQSIGDDTDARSDIYSFACAMYETLTGRPPFIGDTAFATILKHQNDQPPRLADFAQGEGFPPWLGSLISRMLTKKKEKRLQSIQEVLDVFAFYKKSDRKKARSKSAGKIARQEVRTAHLARDANPPLGNGGSKSNLRNVILAFSLTALILGGSAFVFIVGIRQRAAQLDHPKRAVQVARLSQPSTGGCFFKRIEQGRWGPVKVFRFPQFSIGRFQIGYGSKQQNQECVNEIRVPADEDVTFVPGGMFLGKVQFFSGFGADDLAGVYFDPKELTQMKWDDSHVFALMKCARLKRLSVRNTEVSGAAIDCISKFKNLIFLDVTGSLITGKDLARLKNLNGLQELLAADTEQMPEFFKLVDTSKLNLKTLFLGGNKLTDHDLLAISQIGNLESLSLDNNRVTGDGIKYLTKLSHLRVLNLSDTDVGPEVFETLGKIGTLRQVVLPDRCLGAVERARFKQILPLCNLQSARSSKR